MTVQTLTQEELDAVYHQAIFDCDAAFRAVLVRYFDGTTDGNSTALYRKFRDDLLDQIGAAIDECETKHMGDRLDGFLERLMAGEFKARENPVG